MITFVSGVEPIRMIHDQWMPPGMVMIIVDDDAFVYKNGKAFVMPVRELRKMADSAFGQVMGQKILDASQPL
jgi:hypothetical protein